MTLSLEPCLSKLNKVGIKIEEVSKGTSEHSHPTVKWAELNLIKVGFHFGTYLQRFILHKFPVWYSEENVIFYICNCNIHPN
jgi:hypothetical protein